jgi:hypothetical protein
MKKERTHRGFFDNNETVSYRTAGKSLGRAIRTLVITPPHTEVIHISMNSMKIARPLPMQPPIEEVQEAIANKVLPKVDIERIRKLTPQRLICLAGILMQFTDYAPRSLSRHANTSYAHLESLYEAVIDQSRQTGQPLTFPEQLEVSLEQNEGDLQNSLWQLFIGSRFFARRRDGSIIDGLPKVDNAQKLKSMVAWQESLAACAPYSAEGYQDAAGDTYYCWTHALAKTAYEALPSCSKDGTKALSRVFEHGTKIMQGYVNKVYPEGGGATARDHLMAAKYGNAIGKVCVHNLLPQLR